MIIFLLNLIINITVHISCFRVMTAIHCATLYIGMSASRGSMASFPDIRMCQNPIKRCVKPVSLTSVVPALGMYWTMKIHMCLALRSQKTSPKCVPKPQKIMKKRSLGLPGTPRGGCLGAIWAPRTKNHQKKTKKGVPWDPLWDPLGVNFSSF